MVEEKIIERDIETMTQTAREMTIQAQVLEYLVQQKQQRVKEIELILQPLTNLSSPAGDPGASTPVDRKSVV